jgi:hypothetical protein
VIPKGHVRGHKIWILLKGALEIPDQDIMARSPACFGTSWLRYLDSTEVLNDDVIAKGDVSVALIKTKKIESVIGTALSTVCSYNMVLNTLDKIYLFKFFPPSKRASIITQLEPVTF